MVEVKVWLLGGGNSFYRDEKSDLLSAKESTFASSLPNVKTMQRSRLNMRIEWIAQGENTVVCVSVFGFLFPLAAVCLPSSPELLSSQRTSRVLHC